MGKSLPTGLSPQSLTTGASPKERSTGGANSPLLGNEAAEATEASRTLLSYAERKEQQKRLNRAEKALKESERKIESMETRMGELDELLMQPENASDMTLVTEYTSTKRALDEEMERWEKLGEEVEKLKNELTT